MRVKAKTWGVIGKQNKQQLTKSQLQTVLITASGPQALNALVHRERYTQGSRQNRCVSSQEALALRAKVTGTGTVSVRRRVGHLALAVLGFGRVHRRGWPLARRKATAPEAWVTPRLPVAPRARASKRAPRRLPTQNRLRRGIQLYN